jgi:hypothetical protein
MNTHTAQCPCKSCGGRYAPLDHLGPLRAGDRVADTHTLREGGTVLDVDSDRVAVHWDRALNGWGTYSPDTVTLVYRADAQTARELAAEGARLAHREL